MERTRFSANLSIWHAQFLLRNTVNPSAFQSRINLVVTNSSPPLNLGRVFHGKRRLQEQFFASRVPRRADHRCGRRGDRREQGSAGATRPGAAQGGVVTARRSPGVGGNLRGGGSSGR